MRKHLQKLRKNSKITKEEVKADLIYLFVSAFLSF